MLFSERYNKTLSDNKFHLQPQNILFRRFLECLLGKYSHCRIAKTILNKVGVKYIQWGILLVGIIFGLSMFYEVAFMILAPLIMSIAKEAKISFLRLEMTMVAAATTAHRW